MSQITLVLVIIIAIFLAILFISSIVAFNIFQRIRMNVEKAASDLDVLLKQRFDEIPQIVATCKGFMKHEKEVFVELVSLRSNFRKADDGQDVSESLAPLIALNFSLGGTLGRLFTMAEEYPELKSSEHLMRLSLRLSELEERIADRREYYNEAVSLYNARLSSFPETIFTQIFGYEPKMSIAIRPHEHHPHDPTNMKTILVDAVHTLFSPEDTIFGDVHGLLSQYPEPKIIVTNAPQEKFTRLLGKLYNYEIFTLERDPAKSDWHYFETLLEQKHLDPQEVVYFDHKIENVLAAQQVGISAYYFDSKERNIGKLGEFLDEALS